VLLVSLDTAGSGHQANDLKPIYLQLLARLAAIPGVRSAALSSVTPVSAPARRGSSRCREFRENAEDRRRVVLNSIAPKYFRNARHTVAGRARFQVR